MWAGRVRTSVTALALAVVTVGMVVVTAAAGTGLRSSAEDHDRRLPVLLVAVGDTSLAARPEEQRGDSAFADDASLWAASGRPRASGFLSVPPSAVSVAIRSRIVLPPRGPPLTGVLLTP